MAKPQRDKIIVRGARVNNLKNVTVAIPRDKLVVVTGLSGSGKSSLAFDVVHAEGNRRYMESLSSYARSFLGVMAKPDVDKIENLGPSIAIDQKSVARSPRSTVGTLTECYDYLRVLFAKIGIVHCPHCTAVMNRKKNKEIVEEVSLFPDGTKIAILSFMEPGQKNVTEVLRDVQQMGYARVRFNGKIMTVSEALLLASPTVTMPVDIVIDRITMEHAHFDRERLADSIETAMKVGKGTMTIATDMQGERRYNTDYKCAVCGLTIPDITPRHFSFNNPEGACDQCGGLGVRAEIDPQLLIPNDHLSIAEGAIHIWSKSGGKMNGMDHNLAALTNVAKRYKFSLTVSVKNLSKAQLAIVLYGTPNDLSHNGTESDLGGVRRIPQRFGGVIKDLEKKYQETKSEYLRAEIEKYMTVRPCPHCNGKRLKKQYLSILVRGKSIIDYAELPATQLITEAANIERDAQSLPAQRKVVASVLREMRERLQALEDVGIGYISMARSSETLSGGEAQRIRLAVQMKSELMGIIYVLDEPSIGLHGRDTEKLIAALTVLRNSGNSLLVVEHDAEVMKAADWIIDLGPGAGEEGGKIIFEGSPQTLKKAKTLTAQYLTGKKNVSEKKNVRVGSRKNIVISGATEHNLKNITVAIPLEKFVVVSGVSGSGKSTLVSNILARVLARHFFGARAQPGAHTGVKGLHHIDKVITINQEPIGRTPRSNAATYTGVLAHIRELFASTEEARERSYTASQFSFNMRGGRCEECQGDGMKRVEMYLLPDMYVVCEACKGTRYSAKTLEIEYSGVTIADVLTMSVHYALQFFKNHPLITEKLKVLDDVGLGYLTLGQSAPHLSSGEAQRIKLATELSRKATGNTLYILDEPTIGLHFEDTKRLLGVLDALVDKGNTVLVVEHNPDVIRHADWVIDLGPEGGDKGGEILFEGTPTRIKKCKKSWTARYL